METLLEKQQYILGTITDRKVKFNYHDAKVSRLEAVFARGDRKLCKVMLEAHKAGIKFDAWDEYFDYDKWMQVFENCGIDPAFYANREFGKDEVLPWDIIDIGVTKEFLLRENKKAHESKMTPNCREKCSACGADCLGGEKTWCNRKLCE